jgi:hypothetical protein
VNTSLFFYNTNVLSGDREWRLEFLEPLPKLPLLMGSAGSLRIKEGVPQAGAVAPPCA